MEFILKANLIAITGAGKKNWTRKEKAKMKEWNERILNSMSEWTNSHEQRTNSANWGWINETEINGAQANKLTEELN